MNIVSKDNEIEKMIRQFDKDKDGKVSKQEFQEILTEAGVNLSRPQMETLMRHVGFQHKAGGDKIDANDFINRFALTFKTDDTMAGHGVEKDQWANLALERLGRHMLKIPRGKSGNHKSWRQALFADNKSLADKPSTALFEIFKRFDTDGDGLLSREEFVNGIRTVPDLEEVLVEGHPLNDQDLDRIARYIDQSGDGTLNYLEFIKAFNFEDKYGDVLNNQLFEDITTTLFRNRNALLCGCQFFDYDGHAKVTHEQFEDVLEALSSVLKKPETPFTPSQIARVASAATDAQEEVRYMDFVNSFELFDAFQADKGPDKGIARCLLRHETLEQAANDVEKSQRK
jgi:Ca2+-binding EF-hand superfamily protein